MDVFDLYAKLTLDTSEYHKGLNEAKADAQGVGDILSAGFKVVVAAITAATGAVVGLGAKAVQVGSTFDSAMGGVAATLGQTVDELDASVGEVDTSFGHFSGTLRDFAIYMGQNTVFSATQAAGALNYMALAGYNTQESMEMLPTVLDMAAAGGMELAEASDMITDTQKAMGISFERTKVMVNEFAKAASTGNTSVSQLGEAMLRVGGLGAELNGGFITLADGTQAEVDNVQELEIAFTAMANAGIKGSEAGTHMRNMLLKLASPTDDGAAAFENLGISIFDSEGKMRSLGGIMGDLSTALGNLTQQEKLQAISDIFNTRDTASAEALMAAMAEDWDNIGEAILGAGEAASEMAETKLDNLNGDVTRFNSAMEAAYISINDKISPALRDFVQFGTDGVSKLTAAFQEGGFEGAMAEFGNLLSEGVTLIVQKIPDMVKAGTKLIIAFIKGLKQNKGKLGAAVKEIVDVILENFSEEFPELKSMFDSIQVIFDGVFGWITDHEALIKSALKGILAGFIAFETVSTVLTTISTGIELISAAIAVMNGEMALTALVNPYTAIAASIAVVIGLMTTMDDLERQEREAYLEGLTKISEEDQKRIDNAHRYMDTLNSIYESNQKVTESVDSQYASELALKDELAQIVDENGRVKQGYEERATVITTQLNEAFGTELQLQDDVIQNYDIEMQKIDQIIEKKKAEALLDANKDAYAQALKEQLTLYDDMNTKQEEYNATMDEYEAALNRAFVAWDQVKKAGDATTGGAAMRELEESSKIVEENKIKLESLNGQLIELQDSYYHSQDFITDYNNLLEATTKGTGDLDQAISNMTNNIVEKAPEKYLKKQAEEALAALDNMIKAQEQGVSVSEEQLTLAIERAQAAIDALTSAGEEGQAGYAKGLETDADVIKAAKKMVDDGLDTVRKTQDSHSPAKEFEKEGDNAIEGYKKGMEDKFPDLFKMLGEKLYEVRDYFYELKDEATEWGSDMIGNFIIGVENKLPSLTAIVAKAAQIVNSNLGFSEPEEGPLSDFHTYAPDMMKLFAEGIEDNAYLITDAIDKSFDIAEFMPIPEEDYQRNYRSNTTGALNHVVELLQEILENGMDISLEGEAADIFHVVERQNRIRTKATGYNSLAAAGG